MWECHSDGRNLTKWLNLLSIFLDFYELRRNWGSKTNIQQKKISQYPALLISHLLITHIYLIYISSSNRVERLATVKVDPSHWKSICKTLRKYSASNYQGSLKMLSNPTTRHSWCRPAMPEVDLKDTSKISRKWPRKGVTSIVESTRIERLVTVDVDPSYRKSICKTLRKYSASNYDRKLELLSHRLDSTRIERLVTVDVDPSQRKSICKILRKYSASGYKRGLQIFSNRTNTLI